MTVAVVSIRDHLEGMLQQFRLKQLFQFVSDHAFLSCPRPCSHGGFAEVLVRFENHLPVCVVKNDCESLQHLGAYDPCQVRGG